jgi:predicted metal-binding membrane protein
VRSVTGFEPEPILNPFNTTVMPQDYRNKLIALMVCCTVAVVAWDYFIVNGIRRRLAAKKRAAREMDEPSFETEGNDAMDTIDTDGSAFPKEMPEGAAKEMDEPSFETEGNDAMDTIDTDGSAFLKEMPEEYVA